MAGGGQPDGGNGVFPFTMTPREFGRVKDT